MQHNLTNVRHIVAVAAGKGGVGKSTLALNLALYLKGKGFKVGLLDADIYGPSIRKMLPEEVAPVQDPQRNERIIPGMSKGIKLISMAYFLKEGGPASVRAPIANGIIQQFIHSVEWGQLDFLLIDFPPGTGDIQLTLIQEGRLSGAVLVTTPQEIALLDVGKAAEMLCQMQVPIVGLVENMSFYQVGGEKIFPFGEGNGERFARENGLLFLGKVPIEPAVSRCCDQGKSLFEEASATPAAIALGEIGELVRQQLEAFEKLGETRLKDFEVLWK